MAAVASRTDGAARAEPSLDGRVVTDEGEAKACDNSKAAYPDVNWKDGKLLNRVSEKELKAWIGK
ncbi:MAG: hypothetical protein IJ540_11335 [Prevotella sp.]|jgi:hypothetical protein|nr:hypothetical protein [Prevotella sp.]